MNTVSPQPAVEKGGHDQTHSPWHRLVSTQTITPRARPLPSSREDFGAGPFSPAAGPDPYNHGSDCNCLLCATLVHNTTHDPFDWSALGIAISAVTALLLVGIGVGYALSVVL